MENIIEFKDFSFKYRSQAEPTLTSINLAIKRGEKVLIVGPSGSGKSTLGHCLNGLIPFSYTGEITGSLTLGCADKKLETKDASISQISKMVGTVLQDTDGQFIGLTVAEDIAFAMENDCVAQNEMIERVLEVSKTVSINTHLKNAPQELSGGQKQRCSLAGVMVDDVDILLFDEPLANLDPATGKQAITLIGEIHKRTGVTVVIIEHRLEDVLHLDLDRIIVVYDGKIVADMQPEALLWADILTECGLREPLYISALKYAGCIIQPDKDKTKRTDIVDQLDGGMFAERMKTFAHNIEPAHHGTSDMEILRLEHVSFGYDAERPVLRDVSFSIQKGEMISIVGRNGAGKSTLTKLVCGFVKHNNGKIYYEGRDICDDTIKERAKRIGMVMQNPNEMIVKPGIFDEVALGLRVRGESEAVVTERVNEALRVCGLYPMRNWPVSALSFGQKKRVTIASILSLSPQLIILDEPTAGQDFKHYTEIMEFLKTLNEQGITIIMITHDMHLMLEYTDRCLVMSDGELLFDGSTAYTLSDAQLIEKANLKETSLYTLAVKVGIDEPIEFVQNFITWERKNKKHQNGDRKGASE